jgi:hypothetical protein
MVKQRQKGGGAFDGAKPAFAAARPRPAADEIAIRTMDTNFRLM